MQDNIYFKKNLQELINSIDNQIANVKRDTDIPIDVRENILSQLTNLKQTYIKIFDTDTESSIIKKIKNKLIKRN